MQQFHFSFHTSHVTICRMSILLFFFLLRDDFFSVVREKTTTGNEHSQHPDLVLHLEGP